MARKVFVAEVDLKNGALVRKLADSEKRMMAASDRMAKGINRIGEAFIAAFSVREIGYVLNDMVNLGNKIKGVENAFKRIDQGNYLKKLREATRGTIDDLKLMQSAVFAEKFNIPFEVLTKGMEFAQMTAQETGEDFRYMMESFVTGTARQSVMILDNLGISSKQLSDEIKITGDFMTALGNIMDRQLAQMRDSMDETILTNQKMNAELNNYKNEVAKGLATAWNAATGFMEEHFVKGIMFIDKFATAISKLDFTKLTKWLAGIPELEGSPTFARDFTNAIYKSQRQLDKGGKQNVKTIGDIKKEIQDLTKELETVKPKHQRHFEILAQINKLQKSITIEKKKETKELQSQVIQYQTALEYFNALTKSYGNTSRQDLIDKRKNDIEGGGKLSPAGPQAIKEQINMWEEYSRTISVTSNAMSSFFDDLYIRAATDSSKAEQAFINMANVFIREVERMIAEWVTFSLIKGILSIGSIAAAPLTGGASAVGAIAAGLKHGGSVTNIGGNISYSSIPKFAGGGSSFMVPSGYPNDSFPIMVQSGERVDVTPAGRAGATDSLLKDIKGLLMNQGKDGGRGGMRAAVKTIDNRALFEVVWSEYNRATRSGENTNEII